MCQFSVKKVKRSGLGLGLCIAVYSWVDGCISWWHWVNIFTCFYV